MPSQLVLPLEPNNAMTRADFIVAPRQCTRLGLPGFLSRLAGARRGAVRPVGFRQDPSGPHLGGAVRRGAAGRARPCATRSRGAGGGGEYRFRAGFAHEPALFAMLEQGAPLLLTGRGAPPHWPVALPDLASRFRALLAFRTGRAGRGAADGAGGQAVRRPPDCGARKRGDPSGADPGTLARPPCGISSPGPMPRALAEKKPVNLAVNSGTYGELTDFVTTDLRICPKFGHVHPSHGRQ